MSREALVLSFAVGAALLALWVDVRFVGPRVWSWTAIWINFVGGLAALTAVSPLMGAILDRNDTTRAALLALFAIFLPGFVYAFLSGLWMAKRLQHAMGLR